MGEPPDVAGGGLAPAAAEPHTRHADEVARDLGVNIDAGLAADEVRICEHLTARMLHVV